MSSGNIALMSYILLCDNITTELLTDCTTPLNNCIIVCFDTAGTVPPLQRELQTVRSFGYLLEKPEGADILMSVLDWFVLSIRVFGNSTTDSNSLKARVQHFVKYTYLLYCYWLDMKINTTNKDKWTSQLSFA